MELKDFIGYTGIEAANLDEFKQKFDEKFVAKSTVPDVDELKAKWTGQMLGPIQTKIKSTFGLTAEETAGFKTWEEFVALADKKVKDKEQELTELSLKTSDGALKELNEKLEKSNRLSLDYKAAVQEAQQALELEKQQYAGKLKSFKTESVLKDSLFKVQPKLAKLTEAEQFHMDSLIKENIVIDFDENDSPIVLNKEGKRYTDPNKAGGFLSVDGVIELIAAEKNYIKKNNADERRSFNFGQQNNGGQSQQNKDREIHPNARKKSA